MKYTISAKYNRDLIKDATWHFWKRTCGKETLLCLVLIIIALYMWFVIKSNSWITATFLALSIICLFILVTIYFVYKNRSLKIFKQMESPDAEWHFGDTSFSVKSDIGKGEYRWSAIIKLWRFNNVWLLFYANEAYSTLPVDSMSNEIMEFIRKKIESSCGKII